MACLLLAAWLAPMALLGQAPPLTGLDQVRRLDRAAAESSPAVVLEGVILGFVPGGGFFLQQGQSGIEVTATPGLEAAGRGWRVRIEGVVTAEGHATKVRPTRIVPLSEDGVPRATRVAAKEAKDARHHGTRLAIEGRVIATTPVAGKGMEEESAPDSMLVVDAGDGQLVPVIVQRHQPPLELERLQGARVRVEGIARPVRDPVGRMIDTDLLATPQDRVEVVAGDGPGTRQPGPMPIVDLLRGGSRPGETAAVRIRGVVTARLSALSGIVQDDSGAILFRTVSPAECLPGQRVELTGTSRVELAWSNAQGMDLTPVVFEAHDVQKLGLGALPRAEESSPVTLARAWLQFRRIETAGHVISATRLADPAHFHLSLSCGAFLVDALGADARTNQALPAAGSLVRVRGALDRRAQPDTDFQPVRLHLAGLDDVEVIDRPPEDLTRALSWALGAVLALALAATAWALALRRGVRLRTADLATANEALALASRARADFLAHMSHEVRTPVHAMLGLLQVLARHPLPPEPMAMVRRLSSAGRSLVAIVNDALDLSKIDAGQLTMDAQPFHPNTVLEHIDELFAARAAEKGIAWSVARLPPGSDGLLVGDRFRLQQVLGNLASNAIKFTRQGHVLVSAKTTFSPGDDKASLRVSVEDSGPGITPETLARLFRPYAQASPSSDGRLGGTGLGLVISRRLAELMGGSIQAFSQPGTGSTFTLEVELPVASGSNHGVPLEEDAPETTRPPGRRLEGCRILVADDHPMNLGIVQAAIEMEGGCALLVGDGQQAADAMEREATGFDAVVMDIQMPVMDGLQATRIIRAMPGADAIPVVLCSAGIRKAQREAALAAGASDFIPKPFDLDDMVRVLVRLIQPGPLEADEPLEETAAPATAPALMDAAGVPFPRLPGIDAAKAEGRFAGNLPLFLRTLGRFQAEFASMSGDLDADLDLGHWREAGRRMHGLHGAAAMLGAPALAAMARQLEAQFREPEVDAAEARKRVDELVRELHRLLEAILALDPEMATPPASSALVAEPRHS